MTITTTTCIGFKIPEEAELLRLFTEKQNFREWKISTTTSWINYEKSASYILDVSLDKDNEKE